VVEVKGRCATGYKVRDEFAMEGFLHRPEEECDQNMRPRLDLEGHYVDPAIEESRPATPPTAVAETKVTLRLPLRIVRMRRASI